MWDKTESVSHIIAGVFTPIDFTIYKLTMFLDILENGSGTSTGIVILDLANVYSGIVAKDPWNKMSSRYMGLFISGAVQQKFRHWAQHFEWQHLLVQHLVDAYGGVTLQPSLSRKSSQEITVQKRKMFASINYSISNFTYKTSSVKLVGIIRKSNPVVYINKFVWKVKSRTYFSPRNPPLQHANKFFQNPWVW